MRFRLNQAPTVALNALSDAKLDRHCGYIVSFVGCFFTCGANLLCGDEADTDTAGSTCCWPKALTDDEVDALNTLKADLQGLLSTEQFTNVDTLDESITAQLATTRQLLTDASSEGSSIVGYLSAIEAAIDDLEDIEAGRETDALASEFSNIYSGGGGRFM